MGMTLGPCPNPAYGPYSPTFPCRTLLVEQDCDAPKGNQVEVDLIFFRQLVGEIVSFELVEKNNTVGQLPCFPLCLISLLNVILECLLIVIGNRKMDCSVSPLKMWLCLLFDEVFRCSTHAESCIVFQFQFHLSSDKTKPSPKGQTSHDIFVSYSHVLPWLCFSWLTNFNPANDPICCLDVQIRTQIQYMLDVDLVL